MDNLKEHAKRKAVVEEVPTPEWAEIGTPSVFIRALNIARRDAYYSAALWNDDGTGEGHVDMSNGTAKLCAMALCDQSGTWLYTIEDAEWLGEMEVQPMGRIAERIRVLSGLESGSVEVAQGN